MAAISTEKRHAIVGAPLFQPTTNRLPLVEGTDFEGDTSSNNRNTFGPFGKFDIQVPNNATPIRDDDFYLQPSSFNGCRTRIPERWPCAPATVPRPTPPVR